jgi:hypothetical protein
MLAERDLDDQASFRTPDAMAAARAFARHVSQRAGKRKRRE